jgi:receptor protein-tyrosine kinase
VEQFLLSIIRRWFWIIGLATLIAGLATYWVSAQQPTVYEAQARLIVGPGVESPNPDLNSLRAGGQLIQTYAELATTRPLLQAIIDDLDLDISTDILNENIEVVSNDETQILTIRVQDRDPVRASIIANAVAERLVRVSPSGAGEPDAQLKGQMRDQAEKVEASIASSEAAIKRLEASLQSTPDQTAQSSIGGSVAQANIVSTSERIHQLEAELQAAFDVDRQRLISSQILPETVAGIEARIEELQADFQAATDIQSQLVILTRVAQERDHLSNLEGTEVERQQRILDQILQEGIANAEKRIAQLEADLQDAGSADDQRLVGDQIEQERDRLADLQRSNVEGQRQILSQVASENVASIEARIAQLEAAFQATTDPETQRQILGQNAQERQRLFDTQRAEWERQHQILGQVLQVIVASTEAVITQLEADLQVAPTDVETQQIIAQISQERARLTDAHRTLATLYASLYESLQETFTNQVKIVEPAVVGVPTATQLHFKILLGAIAGLILSLTIVLGFEYFDDTIRSGRELSQTTNLPVLATIARHKALRAVGRGGLVVQALPESHAAESYRMLGTKLLPKRAMKKQAQRLILAENGKASGAGQDTSDDHPLRSVLVSSAQVNDDTGQIAANLAVVLSQAGHQVTLVDANLHRPTIGPLFGLDTQYGLAELLTDQAKSPELIPVDWAPGLSILPSGAAPPNPFELLASSRIAYLIQELQSQVDFVIIAASPLLSVADSLILASQVDGVVIVARSGKTRRDMVNYAVESLFSHDANILGIVLDHNRSSRWPVSSRRTSAADARVGGKSKVAENLETRVFDGDESARSVTGSWGKQSY